MKVTVELETLEEFQRFFEVFKPEERKVEEKIIIDYLDNTTDARDLSSSPEPVQASACVSASVVLNEANPKDYWRKSPKVARDKLLQLCPEAVHRAENYINTLKQFTVTEITGKGYRPTDTVPKMLRDWLRGHPRVESRSKNPYSKITYVPFKLVNGVKQYGLPEPVYENHIAGATIGRRIRILKEVDEDDPYLEEETRPLMR